MKSLPVDSSSHEVDSLYSSIRSFKKHVYTRSEAKKEKIPKKK